MKLNHTNRRPKNYSFSRSGDANRLDIIEKGTGVLFNSAMVPSSRYVELLEMMPMKCLWTCL